MLYRGYVDPIPENVAENFVEELINTVGPTMVAVATKNVKEDDVKVVEHCSKELLVTLV